MNNIHTKVIDPSIQQRIEQALANLEPDPSMVMGDWVKQTARRLGVTPNRVYKALRVTG